MSVVCLAVYFIVLLMNKSQDNASLLARHLDWSDKQRRILTADGQAEAFFHTDRGFAFEKSELPHHYLMSNKEDNRQVFQEWKNDQQQHDSLIAGAWQRVLFHGGWEFTTLSDERTYNLQTNTIFVDLRVPATREQVLLSNSVAREVCSIQDLDGDQLRYYARQHVFAGYSKLTDHHGPRGGDREHAISSPSSAPYRWSCTRHHVMDWNFVGTPRTRPNKWWIEKIPTTTGAAGDVWKEWAFATDFAGQHYYCEQWERLETLPVDNNSAEMNGDEQPQETMLALRMNKNDQNKDGILVVIGNEFNYCFSQRFDLVSNMDGAAPTSLVALVDDAVHRGDLEAARKWLQSIQGGHGHVHTADDNVTHNSWTIDAAIEFWKEGSSLIQPGDVTVSGSSMEDCNVTWNGDEWSVFESSFDSIDVLVQLFGCMQMRRRVR